MVDYQKTQIWLKNNISGKCDYEYLRDIPEDKYTKVKSIKNLSIFNEDFDIIYKCISLKIVNIIIHKDSAEEIYDSDEESDEEPYEIKELLLSKIKNEIALLQELMEINVIVVTFSTYSISRIIDFIGEKIFIYQNKMLWLKTKRLIEIPDNIRFLNVIFKGEIELDLLPYGLKHLHITIPSVHTTKLDLTNLPVSLKTIIVSFVNKKYTTRKKIKEIVSTIKLPYGCNLIID